MGETYLIPQILNFLQEMFCQNFTCETIFLSILNYFVYVFFVKAQKHYYIIIIYQLLH